MTHGDDLIGQRQHRLNKVAKLRELGIDPYPSQSQKDHANQYVIDHYGRFEGQTVTLAGRLVSLRDHGKVMFGDIQDQSGLIQICLRKDTTEGNLTNAYLPWEHRKLCDVGDIIQIEGEINKTQQGHIALFVKHMRILAKSIRPLPNEINDKETQFRKRYLDHILNPEHKWRFEKTAQITFAIRQFLNSRGFLEIKTPILQSLSGGTSAKPFRTHINALDVEFSLAISHELYLKRLITAGFENVYNITGYFRNEGIDRSHNPEFSMLETMTAYKNYEYNMNLVEEMYRFIGEQVFNKTTFTIRGQEVDFAKPWERIRMIDAVTKYAGYDFTKVKTIEEAHAIMRTAEMTDDLPDTIAECVVRIFERHVERQLIQPTFITHHPVEISPLAKRCSDDSRFVERFEIFIGGMEGGDNWTELNDPVDLYHRFQQQMERRRRGDEEAHMMDIDFIEMMEYGMPPTTGLGPGIERLAMMFTETEYIDDILFFPLMRPAQPSKIDKELYDIDEKLLTQGEQGGRAKESWVAHAIITNHVDIPSWKKMNVAAHLAASMAARQGKSLITIDTSYSKDNEPIPMNIMHAIVIKQADSSASLLTLKHQADSEGLVVAVFTEDMATSSNDIKVNANHRQQIADEIIYLGVLIFGNRRQVEKLTKDFELWS